MSQLEMGVHRIKGDYILLGMVQSFPPHLSCQKLLCNLFVAFGSTALLLLALCLISSSTLQKLIKQTCVCTYNRGHLQCWRPPIENEDGFDAIEQQLAYPPEETNDMSVHKTAAFLVAHGGLKLVYPDA